MRSKDFLSQEASEPDKPGKKLEEVTSRILARVRAKQGAPGSSSSSSGALPSSGSIQVEVISEDSSQQERFARVEAVRKRVIAKQLLSSIRETEK